VHVHETRFNASLELGGKRLERFSDRRRVGRRAAVDNDCEHVGALHRLAAEVRFEWVVVGWWRRGGGLGHEEVRDEGWGMTNGK
jgi:hypothetical protein